MTEGISLDEARAKSRAVWDEMAPGWESKSDYLWSVTRRVGEWLVEHAAPQPGETVLEIACGPGDTGYAAARLVGSEGKVVATDFSPEMVEVARRRAGELGVANVETRVMDAEKMDLSPESVDAILCRWGFMLMLDPQAALGECARVLRPGGRLAFSVWAGPEKNPWVTTSGMVMTQLGYPPQKDPWGPGGMFSMSDHDKIRSMLAAAGLQETALEEMAVEWRFADFSEMWSFITQLAGAIAAFIKELPASEVARLRDGIEDAAATYKTDDGYRLPGITINVAARK